MAEEQKQTERMKLTILEVEEVKTVGDRKIPKLTFKARNDEGKEYKYFTFRPTLFATIQQTKGKTIEADVEIVERDTGSGVFIDRKVNEIYVDGAPVSPSATRARGSYPSPEVQLQIAQMNRVSIEGQVALKELGEWLRSDKPMDEALFELYKKVLRNKIGAFMGTAMSTPPASVTSKEVSTAGAVLDKKPQPPLVQTQRAQFEEHRKRREVSVQEVREILQVKTLEEWIAQGHNLQEAMDAIDAFVEAKGMARLVKTQQGELSEVDEDSND